MKPAIRENIIKLDLTPREKIAAALFALGATRKELARRLFISECTAATHAKNIHMKTGCRNVADLTRSVIAAALHMPVEKINTALRAYALEAGLARAFLAIFFLFLNTYMIYLDTQDLARARANRKPKQPGGKQNALKTHIMYKLDENQIRQFLTSAAEMGAKQALIKTGNEKTQINQAEAWRRYTRRRVESWVKSGKVKPVKIRGNVMYSVTDLESISQTIDLIENHIKSSYEKRKEIGKNGHSDVDVRQPERGTAATTKANRRGFNSIKRQTL